MHFVDPNMSKEVEALAFTHALADYPNESCGLIVNGNYIPCENISKEPDKAFRIDPVYFAGMLSKGGVSAVIHSHPDGTVSPTADDMASQIACGLPFGIVSLSKTECKRIHFFGDFLLNYRLLGREFIHGVFDCYSLVRSYFWQEKGIYLKDYPRDDEWWMNGGGLYEANFAKEGFVPISREQVEPGDCFIGRHPKSPVPNHAGVFLDRGLVLHHVAGRLSMEQPVGLWQKYLTHLLRYAP